MEEIIAKVNTLANTNKDAPLRTMIRESLDSNSKFAMTAITANLTLQVQQPIF
jgi:hypothetical protein